MKRIMERTIGEFLRPEFTSGQSTELAPKKWTKAKGVHSGSSAACQYPTGKEINGRSPVAKSVPRRKVPMSFGRAERHAKRLFIKVLAARASSMAGIPPSWGKHTGQRMSNRSSIVIRTP